jgi:site-specific DNA-methyltransferase (adenine-specific)
MLELNKIYNMDCLEGLKLLDDNGIDLTVTSPPYDNLRTYNGFSFDFESIAKELYRVTKQGGVVVWIVGDATIKGSETGTSFKQALYFKEIGFNLHDTMIYKKINPVPYYHNRYNPSFEYMFVLSKGKPKTFNGIRIERKTNGVSLTRTFRYPNGETKLANKQSITKDKLMDNVWELVCNSEIKTHPATFPNKLANDHIISWSNENDIVMDIFMGSGTTAKMAFLNNRKYIGFELSKEYCDIAEKRIESTKRQIDIFDLDKQNE